MNLKVLALSSSADDISRVYIVKIMSFATLVKSKKQRTVVLIVTINYITAKQDESYLFVSVQATAETS